MTTYAEKLADPRWQKKRLRILERDEWACRWCGDNTTELNVHHLIYHKGMDPWDYEDRELLTVCRPCHDKQTQNLPAAIEKLLRAVRVDWAMQASDVDLLAEYLSGVYQYTDKVDPWCLFTVLDPNFFDEIHAAAQKITDEGYDVPQPKEAPGATDTVSQA